MLHEVGHLVPGARGALGETYERDVGGQVRRARDVAAELVVGEAVPEARAGLDRTSASRPPRRRDASPRNIRVAAAASPRRVSTEYPRRSRSVAATRLQRVRAAMCTGWLSVDACRMEWPSVPVDARACAWRARARRVRLSGALALLELGLPLLLVKNGE